MNNKAGAAKPKRFSTSLVVGLLLVPVSAVAAVALVNPDAAAEPEEVVAAEVVVDTASTTEGVADTVVPEIASGDDIAEACGEQGLALVVKESEGTISPLEQAALDSLRAICLTEGLELPGPPAPEAVVQTVTVVAGPSTSGDSGSSDGSSVVDDAAAEFEAAYEATVNHINAAIADGANGEKIVLAEQLVGEAAALADSGDYEAGIDKLADARQAADEASRGGHHDDDDDDHDDDDEHDEEDEEDDDHGDDDEDDH